MYRFINTRRGFTLIEVLVVVLIIGILAAVALPQYQKAVERARIADALAHINAIEKAIELVVLQNGGIPEGNLLGKAWDVEIPLPSDIELANGLSCPPELSYCYDKDWTYSSHCKQNRYCNYRVYRATSPASFSGAGAEIGGGFDLGRGWTRFCYYETDLGEQTCNMVAPYLKIEDIQEGF